MKFDALLQAKPGLVLSLLFGPQPSSPSLRARIGSRIKAERKRLGMTVKQLAAVCSVSKNTAVNWQSGESSPTADCLAALDSAGVDVLFVITGRKATGESK